MTVEHRWGDQEVFHCLLALSLPTLSWASSFVPLMGLPSALLEQPQVWESIYNRAAREYETRLKSGNWTPTSDGGQGELMREVVTGALEQLAIQIGLDVARDLERWVRFHFLCQEARTAMRMWGVVLTYAYLPENSRRGKKKVSPPEALVPLLPEIWDLVNFERRQELNALLDSVAPPPPYEQSPDTYMEHCYEATMISWAFNQALTLKALQTIASRLNDTERQEVVAWAELQLQTMDSRHGYANAEKLCGDKYLRAELPCSDVPSVLDFLTSDET